MLLFGLEGGLCLTSFQDAQLGFKARQGGL
jgi:hypothetical protein